MSPAPGPPADPLPTTSGEERGPHSEVSSRVGEEALLARLAAHLGPHHRLGDDAAWLPEHRLVATVDSQIDGVHLRLPSIGPRRLAKRLVAVNASDLAASAAEPRFGLLALAAPSGFDVDGFLAAAADALAAIGAELVGGDLARCEQLVVTLTLLGRPSAEERRLARSNARAGDRLWVGGTLGESAAGCRLVARGARWLDDDADPLLPPGLPERLADPARRAIERHLAPRPQLELGLALGRLERVAALDVSDGLTKDLARLLDASGVGATIEAAALPLARGTEDLAVWLDADATELALAGGEDYVLLAAAPPEEDLSALGCHLIGIIDAAPGARLRRDGHTVPLDRGGYDHFED